jgi:hypothetical protein
VAPLEVIRIWWHGYFHHFRLLLYNYLIVINVANNVWIFDSYKNNIYLQMLYNWSKDEHVYIIHGPFGDVMMSHDLWVDVKCDFTYATKAIFGFKCWLQLFYNHKLTFFFQVLHLKFGSIIIMSRVMKPLNEFRHCPPISLKRMPSSKL